jgi:2',3'-cyclic-nucleotide 2'-phosphodiesterase (5'-nucleotidase family)
MHRESVIKPAAGGVSPWCRASGVVTFALLGALTGCEKNSAQETPPAQTARPAPAAQPPAPKPTSVTVLITGSPNGQLLPTTPGEGVKPTIGAAELLGWWTAKEKHCPGQVVAGHAQCKNPSTLALTIGDAWNGPAISSFFYGETTAAVMARMGFAASALGNHELDYGHEQFRKNQHVGGFPFLAANLKLKDPTQSKEMEPPGYAVSERQGMVIGVVGLTSPKTVTTVMAGRAESLQNIPDEQALADAVGELQKKAGVDTVLVLADECPSDLQPVVGKHPEWKVSLVAGGRCPEPVNTKEGNTTYVSLGRGFDKYLRAVYTFDASKPEGEQVTGVETSMVEVTGGEGAPEPDAEAVKMISDFKARLDTALGEEIGFTKKAFEKDSKQLSSWVTTAIREQLGTDAVVLNRKGFREGLPAGKVTRGSVYSVLPFENSVMVVEVKGEDLARQLSNPEAVFSGFTPAGKGKFKDARGKPLDPKKEYKVATIEYLYFGGDGFEFEKLDPEPSETGMSWQTPVIDWTKEKATTEAKPLNQLIK